MNLKNAIVSLACVVLFGTGLLIGRQFPAHHFERFGASNYLFDASSGHICQAFGTLPDPSNPNLIDKALTNPSLGDQILSGKTNAAGGHAIDPNAGKPPDGFVEVKPNPIDKALNSEIGSIWASPDKPSATDHVRPCVP